MLNAFYKYSTTNVFAAILFTIFSNKMIEHRLYCITYLLSVVKYITLTKGNTLHLYIPSKRIRELFEKCNIKDDEVVVVGDSGNDIPMLDEFPHSFAMESAPDYVKSHAQNKIRYVYELEDYIKTTE